MIDLTDPREIRFTPSPRILKGLDEIAGYLRIHRRTAWRWIMDYALPAMKSPAGTYMTSTPLIDLWILACSDTIPRRKSCTVSILADD